VEVVSERTAVRPDLERFAPTGAAAPILRVEDIHAGYGKKEILHGVTLGVAPGEIAALIGPNGAGKSTLLKVVAGLVRPTAGHVRFQGADITSLPTHRRARAGIAYLIQGGAVFPSLTAGDHLALGRAAARWGGRESRKNSDDVLLPALKERGEVAAGLFSGGERQALAAAAILATEPALLLADEPSAGLAPAAARQLLRALADASRERGLPVLWVEQRVAEVLPLADRAVLLRNGQAAAETANPREWLDSDVLSALTFGENA
jgi:branched-chain amino acid transport system ATP-binding protein